MSQLFGLLHKARFLFLFFLLQGINLFLIGKNNVAWGVNLFNSTNAVSGKFLSMKAGIDQYLYFEVENTRLVNENKALRERLVLLQENAARPDYLYKVDSAYAKRFDFEVAQVINSTTALTDNYLTLNKGKLDGITPGMGVIGPAGVVGQVMSCSDHYARVYSILHSEFNISAELKNKKLQEKDLVALGLISWDGRSHRIVKLNTIDRYKDVVKGDSVVTSSQNLVFPGNILIGKVAKITTEPTNPFHDIDVKLATDFKGLNYVYIVKNRLMSEQLNLENTIEE